MKILVPILVDSKEPYKCSCEYIDTTDYNDEEEYNKDNYCYEEDNPKFRCGLTQEPIEGSVELYQSSDKEWESFYPDFRRAQSCIENTIQFCNRRLVQIDCDEEFCNECHFLNSLISRVTGIPNNYCILIKIHLNCDNEKRVLRDSKCKALELKNDT